MCRDANPRLVVKRARFSALVMGDLTRAVQNLIAPDSAASAAVDARQEIDLRIGASFTRFQCLLLQVVPRPSVLLPFGSHCHCADCTWMKGDGIVSISCGSRLLPGMHATGCQVGFVKNSSESC